MYRPASVFQLLACSLVTLDRFLKLFLPESLIRLWNRRQTAAIMSVPETSVHKNYLPVFRQNNIWTPRQISPMESESEPSPMQFPAHDQLRRRVFCPDPGHVPASSLRAYAIHQALHARLSVLNTTSAICNARNGGTAFPICLYWSPREPQKKKLSGNV